MPQVKKPPCLIHFLISSLPSSLWGNKKWEAHYKDAEVGKFFGQNKLNRLQMVQFECPRVRNTLVCHPLLESSLSPFSAPTPSLLPLSLQYKELVYFGRPGKKVKNQFNRLQIVHFQCSSVIHPLLSNCLLEELGNTRKSIFHLPHRCIAFANGRVVRI